jgi:hypothetical protein
MIANARPGWLADLAHRLRLRALARAVSEALTPLVAPPTTLATARVVRRSKASQIKRL